MADFDSTIEHNPNKIIVAVLIFVVAAFGTVWMIIATGDGNKGGDAAAQTQ